METEALAVKLRIKIAEMAKSEDESCRAIGKALQKRTKNIANVHLFDATFFKTLANTLHDLQGHIDEFSRYWLRENGE